MAFTEKQLASIAALDEYSFKEIEGSEAIETQDFKYWHCAKGQVEGFKNGLFTLVMMAARNAMKAKPEEPVAVTLKIILSDGETRPRGLTIIPQIQLGNPGTTAVGLGGLIALIEATGLPCE